MLNYQRVLRIQGRATGHYESIGMDDEYLGIAAIFTGTRAN